MATSTITLRSSYGTLTEAQKNIVLTCVTRIVLAYRSYMTLVLGGATSIRSVKPTQHRRDRGKCFMKKVKLGKRDYAVLSMTKIRLGFYDFKFSYYIIRT